MIYKILDRHPVDLADILETVAIFHCANILILGSNKQTGHITKLESVGEILPYIDKFRVTTSGLSNPELFAKYEASERKLEKYIRDIILYNPQQTK
jgi:hypothetical protein